MKRILILPTLALALGLAACGDADNNANSNNSAEPDYQALAIEACETAVRADTTGEVEFIEAVAPNEPTVLDDGARQLPVYGDVDITLGSEVSEEGFACYGVILEEDGQVRTLDSSTGTYMRGSWENQ